MTEDNQEINLDFGKISRIFKKKPKEENVIAPLKKQEDAENQEWSLDSKKIKHFFKNMMSNTKNESQQEESDYINIGRIKNFIIKHQILFVLLGVILIQVIPNFGFLPWGGIWMRMQAEDLHQVDKWAANAVANFYKSQIAEQVNKQYPNLPDANKNKLIEKEFAKIASEQVVQIAAQTKATADQFRSKFQYEIDGKKYTYMPDIDPYAYLRFARNKIETGKFEDTIKDGITWDDHSLAPTGRRVNINIHHYLLVYIHKIISLLNPKIPLMQSATYFPIIMLVLSLIPIFFIGQRLAGKVGGFFAASMLILNAAIFSRTPWGHPDTDAYNVFFPLLITWLFIESIMIKTYKQKILFSALAAFSLAVFSKAWIGGWWYIFYFIIAAMVFNFVYLLITNHKEIASNITGIWKIKELKNTVLISIIFVLCSGIFVSFFSGTAVFINLFYAPFHFSIIKSASHPDLWPNVYTTVAELNPASISSIIDNAGGRLLLGIALLGILCTITIKDAFNKRSIIYAVLFGVWFIATIYASTKGIRFVMLMIPAFSIAFGIAAGFSYKWGTGFMKNSLKIPSLISGPIIIIIFGLLLISPAKSSYASLDGAFPLINDAWWDTLTKIKTESASNAIINSWWDFGHHFKYIADRAVTFDGATQNYPHAHWIGRVLSTDNEDEAIGILRMLDCGSNRAFETLDKIIHDTHKSVDILYEIIVLDKEKARKILQSYVDNPNDILQYTHCSPPEDYFITSDDMIQKAGVWAHFGNWNFERADIWMNLRNLPRDEAIAKMIEKYNYTEEKAESLYLEVQALNGESEANSWISSWPGYASGLTSCDMSNNIVKCGNGLYVNMNNSNSYEVLIKTNNGIGTPQSLVYIDKKTKKLVEKKMNDSNIGVSAVLIPNGKDYVNILVSPELAKSMFTRLFFMNGHGLEHFDLFDSQRQITGGDIYTWKVNWTGHAPNVHPDLIEKTVASDGNTVIVEYIGWLDNGEVFDSSIIDWKNNNISKNSGFDGKSTKPLKFEVGAGKMISGFDSSVVGMSLNAVKTIKILPEDAYGTDPTVYPLGNQTLNFKIKLVGIE